MTMTKPTTSPQDPPPKPTVARWYIDTRRLTATTTSLPLLETLQPTERDAVQKFYHLKDKHMSLASNLLKYLYIHRAGRIPWAQIHLSRTPAPHKRPCFIPSPQLLESHPEPIPPIEFNVSHQNSLVVLAGTTTSPTSTPTPTPPPSSSSLLSHSPNPTLPTSTSPSPPTPILTTPQLGIDITCTNERHGTRGPEPRTRTSFESYISIFTEVFSATELHEISSLTHPTRKWALTSAAGVEYSYRVFFTYWALKEAYIKMTGEALLAPWLRELEFSDVVAPDVGEGPYRGTRVWLRGTEVEGVRVEVVAFEGDYLVATAARGGGVGEQAVDGEGDVWEELVRVDLESDVRPCTAGTCRCLVSG
ncbi:4'-phosphopantetheinyl transferase [Aspergillus heteromorphus CBS 117.55]|uniref:holo-[acyl-carrier-protein] synthase n=1 Tax=Aspergillus heteromorphus CBS 117.55 TaxID=1448321 RepID=A0A317VBV1_9EURO|nr:4'-phosphopantetheinyl transferase [Aspergillus heteromorphus CBS 117.55]PWY70478.1 4'-phosphopantetheinyl transferase [Aspergillus heteromorphus CBS 117.55]